MINGQYHAKYKCGKKTLTVDIAKLASYAHPDGVYEVMVMDSKGADIAVVQTQDFDEAVAAYEQFLIDYPENGASAPLTGKYAKLRADLVTAMKAAEAAAEETDDGGTCNFDSAALYLPRWKSQLVEQAAKEAGTGCFAWNLYGQKRFVFSTPNVGMANKRAVAAEAMTKTLKDLGYNAFCYQQSD